MLRLMIRSILIGFLATSLLISCAESGDQYYVPISPLSYPTANGPGEVFDVEEIESASRIAAIIEAHLRRNFPSNRIRRDAHPKAHGCVDAEVSIRSNIPPTLKHGIFANPSKYKALIRFSNSDEDPDRSDANGDGRGMAIKIYDPPGLVLSNNPDGLRTQDFILISHPTFIVADGITYKRLISYVDADDWLTRQLKPFLSIWALGWTGTKNFIATTSLRIDNPLNTRYWSMVPYQLGSGDAAVAVKYSAASCEPRPVVLPSTDDPNYLRLALQNALSENSACMLLMIQPRTMPSQSVEDPRFEWPEDQAPFYAVADIKIPAQDFNADAKNQLCEEIAYSPWHALEQHKPLGSVNRMRKAIYERISAVRGTLSSSQ